MPPARIPPVRHGPGMSIGHVPEHKDVLRALSADSADHRVCDRSIQPLSIAAVGRMPCRATRAPLTCFSLDLL